MRNARRTSASPYVMFQLLFTCTALRILVRRQMSGCSSRSSRQRNRSSRFLLGTSEAIAVRVSRRPRYSDCCTSTVPHLILADGVCTSVSAVTSWHRCCYYDVIAAKTAAVEYSANTERRRRERCRGTALAVKPLVAANVSQCGSQPRLLIFPDS